MYNVIIYIAYFHIIIIVFFQHFVFLIGIYELAFEVEWQKPLH